jgi:hypothetical protein
MEWRPDRTTPDGLDDDGIRSSMCACRTSAPLFPGKNLKSYEVIALNYLLKHYGYDAARSSKRLEAVITERANTPEARNDILSMILIAVTFQIFLDKQGNILLLPNKPKIR